uniref:Reverse transcriptase domain-containing protein n=1 Tax=Strongyloides venezuelensis TaxID=75913 RepID=A0A0K0G5I4_STRVS
MKIFTGIIHEGRSTTEQIVCLRMIIENHVEYNKPLISIYVDFLKAFDLLHRDKTKNLYENSKIFVKTIIEEEFVISSEAGVKQGDALFPTLFCITLNRALTKVNLERFGERQVMRYFQKQNEKREI